MSDEKPDEKADDSAELKLSKKDLKRLAEMAAGLVEASIPAQEPAGKVNPADRPSFSPTEPAAEAGKIEDFPAFPKKQKGLIPGGARVPASFKQGRSKGLSYGNQDIAQAFSVNKFPHNMDAADFSLSRVAYAQAMAGVTSPAGIPSSIFQKYAPMEKAYYDALASYGHEFKAVGEMVSGQDGAFLAPEIWTNRFWDMLYPAQVLSRLPITRVMMAGRSQHFPKLTNQVAINYFAESAALTATQPQFAQLSLTARKQGTFVQIPNELIRDSAPAADQIIFQHAQTRMAVDRDAQILLGNGQAGVPYGLINATNVGTYTLNADAGNGASPTYSDIVKIINLVRQINNSANVPAGQTDCTGVVGAVRYEQTVANLVDSNSRPLWAYGLNQIGRVPAPGWLGVPNWVLTNIIPTNLTKGTATTASYLIAGDWQYLFYAMRQDVEFMATNVGGAAFQNDQTWIRLISRYDVGVIHPEAFVYANGVLA